MVKRGCGTFLDIVQSASNAHAAAILLVNHAGNDLYAFIAAEYQAGAPIVVVKAEDEAVSAHT